jgi:hypothetical protein
MGYYLYLRLKNAARYLLEYLAVELPEVFKLDHNLVLDYIDPTQKPDEFIATYLVHGAIARCRLRHRNRGDNWKRYDIKLYGGGDNWVLLGIAQDDQLMPVEIKKVVDEILKDELFQAFSLQVLLD